MSSLAAGSTCRISAKLGPFYFRQELVQIFRRLVGQVGKVLSFQVEKGAGEAVEVCGIDEETTDNQNRLVIWFWWIG